MDIFEALTLLLLVGCIIAESMAIIKVANDNDELYEQYRDLFDLVEDLERKVDELDGIVQVLERWKK